MSVQKATQSLTWAMIKENKTLLSHLRSSKIGWLKTVRQALNMSGAQLARRMGVTRAQVSQYEKNELSRSITLKSLDQAAEAMGCKVVYAIVPETSLLTVVEQRALEKAEQLVSETSVHMALEQQSLSSKEIDDEIKTLQEQLVKECSRDLWND